MYTSDIVSKYWKLPMSRGSLFSFLPLCHVAEKLQNVGVGISRHYTVHYCTKFENVATELVEVQPTLLLCVPRLWEKMMEGVQKKIRTGKGLKKHLAKWALSVGEKVAADKYSGKAPNIFSVLQYKLADYLVLNKIRYALGLGKVELLASGAAALGGYISKWFRCIGLDILEDFGQTESTGVICMTESGVESAGTVGKTVPGVEFKIAADGEVLTRGRHVFLGYFKDPSATAQTLENGWLHTGDLAKVNERGLVQILGRKKEILKTSGGKMIAPLPIEEKLKQAEMISQVCMVGDGRKYLSALITLTESVLEELKQKNSVKNGNTVSDPEIIASVKKYIDQINESLASYEQIKRFTILNKEFSIVDGEMTPTLKMKRNIIEKRYQDLINNMYS
ncbi:MAG: AMP-binding protein, partial [Bdellovibrio sp.]|nr:AMP-binding protein [Bdellovibrio sp.]